MYRRKEVSISIFDHLYSDLLMYAFDRIGERSKETAPVESVRKRGVHRTLLDIAVYPFANRISFNDVQKGLHTWFCKSAIIGTEILFDVMRLNYGENNFFVDLHFTRIRYKETRANQRLIQGLNTIMLKVYTGNYKNLTRLDYMGQYNRFWFRTWMNRCTPFTFEYQVVKAMLKAKRAITPFYLIPREDVKMEVNIKSFHEPEIYGSMKGKPLKPKSLLDDFEGDLVSYFTSSKRKGRTACF